MAYKNDLLVYTWRMRRIITPNLSILCSGVLLNTWIILHVYINKQVNKFCILIGFECVVFRHKLTNSVQLSPS
jgi:hypothetical protein